MSEFASGFNPRAAAALLVHARRGGAKPAQVHVLPPDRAAVFAVQDATLLQLGPVGGWKVGAKSPSAEPGCAPLPLSGLLPTGSALTGSAWELRGIELELAVRLARDIDCGDTPPGIADLSAAIDCLLPAIEVVETRLAEGRSADPLAQLADLQSHGALVLGQPVPFQADKADLQAAQAYLAFDGQPVASTRGANPAGDLWRLLGWLAVHCARRGQPLRAGQVITTGSCTGLLFAPEGARVVGMLDGVGQVALSF